MENYLEKFKKKHSYTDEQCSGISETDMKFDIDTDMPEDALEQWLEYVGKNGYLSYAQWTSIDNGYAPKIKNDGMDVLKSEFEKLYKSMENGFNSLFKLSDDSDFEDSDFNFDIMED